MAKTNVENEELSALEQQFRSMLPDDNDEMPEVVPVTQERGELDDEDEDGEPAEDPDEDGEETDVDADAEELADDDTPVEADAEETEEEDLPNQSKKKGSKQPNSKEQNRIIELKRENRRMADELRAINQEKQRINEAKQKETLIEKYKTQGYDEETSNKYANDDIRLARLEERQALNDFREDNYEVLHRYPQAKADIQEIMAKQQKNPDFTVEEICEKMYKIGTDADRRAVESVRNRTQPPARAASDNRVAAASRQAAPAGTILSRSDLRKKAELERFRGTPMTNKEYMASKQKYGF